MRHKLTFRNLLDRLLGRYLIAEPGHNASRVASFTPQVSSKIGRLFFLRVFSGGLDLLHYPVKVNIKQPILRDAVLLKLAFGLGLGDLSPFQSRNELEGGW